MSNFYITLTSNSSVKTANNNLSSFRNQLAKPLQLHAYTWEVRLHTLYCENRFKGDADKEVKYARVCTNIVSPFYNENQCLAVIPRSHKPIDDSVNPISFSSKGHEYFPLNTTYISDIETKIIFYDEKNEPVSQALLGGQPTILVLHFRVKTMSSPLCVMHVEAKGENNINRNKNKAYSFIAEFNNDLQFASASQVEVAVSSIMYKPQFTIKEPDDLKVSIFDPLTHELLHTTQFEAFSGGSKYDLINYVNKKVFGKLKQEAPSKPTILADTKLSSRTKVILISNQNLELQLPQWLAYNLGERSFNSKLIHISPVNQAANLTSELRYEFDVEVDPNAYLPEMGFIYCDFINYNIIGSEFAPILKAFPLTKTPTSHYITYTAETLEFYSLCKSDMTSMRLDLRDVQGNYLPFQFDNSNVIITLIFQKRQ